jgi:hypothetical protein
MSACTLGFTLRRVASRDDLLDACSVRAQAYGHHLPQMAQDLADPDALDLSDGTAVFLCRDKASGRPTGTMRIQSSHHGALMMERSLALPDWLALEPRAEITRLAVAVGADPLTKLCLMKASYMYCMAEQLQWMVIGARNEALIRNYRRLGFKDAVGQGELVPLAHTGGLLHRIMAFDVAAARATWLRARHPLYGFMIDTLHTDLLLGPAPQPQPQVAADGCAAAVAAA